MKNSTRITLILGVLSILLLPFVKFRLGLSNYNFALISSCQSSFSLLGSFLGIWVLVKICLRKVSLPYQETLLIILGAFLSLVSFAMGRYGAMLLFWLPAVILGSLSYQVFMSFLDKIGDLLNKKTQDIRKEVEKRDKLNR